MSTTRLTTVDTQESIHPASTATTLDTQLLGSPKAPPTAQEIQRKLSVAQRTQKGKNKALNAGQSGTESEDELVLSPETAHTTVGTNAGANQGLSSIAERPLSGGEESEDDEDELAGGWKAAKPDQNAMIKADQSLQVLHTGSLWKKGNRRKTWKRRWFVLRRSHLAYYKTPAEYKLLRLLDISEIHAITPVSLKRHDNTFGIVTRGRTFYLQAETQDEVEVWVAKLNEAKDALQSTNSAVAVPIANPPPSAPSAYQAAIVGSPGSSTKASHSPPQLVVPPSPKIVAFSEPSSPIQTNANRRNSRANTVTSSDSEPDEPTKTPVAGSANPKDAGKVIMSGYLMKCGSKRKTWRKRWFVLSADRMVYTGSHMATKPHREIPLSQVLDALEYKSHHREAKHLGPGNSTTGGGGGISGAALTGATAAVTGGTAPSNNANAPAQTNASGGQSGTEEDTAGTLAGTLTGGKFTFKVITPKKTLLLCAPSEEEEVKWIGAIRVLIARRTSAEAGCVAGHVQTASGGGSGSGSGSGSGVGGSEVHKRKEKEKENEATDTSGTRRRSISAAGRGASVVGGDKEK